MHQGEYTMYFVKANSLLIRFDEVDIKYVPYPKFSPTIF